MSNEPALSPGDALADATQYKPTSARYLRPSDFVPTRYIVHAKPTMCKQCAAMQTTSSVMLIKEHPNGGPGATIMQAVDELTMQLPIGLSVLRLAYVPVCHLCWEKTPSVGEKVHASEEQWREALRLEALNREQAAKRKAPPPYVNIAAIDLPDL